MLATSVAVIVSQPASLGAFRLGLDRLEGDGADHRLVIVLESHLSGQLVNPRRQVPRNQLPHPPQVEALDDEQKGFGPPGEAQCDDISLVAGNRWIEDAPVRMSGIEVRIVAGVFRPVFLDDPQRRQAFIARPAARLIVPALRVEGFRAAERTTAAPPRTPAFAFPRRPPDAMRSPPPVGPAVARAVS